MKKMVTTAIAAAILMTLFMFTPVSAVRPDIQIVGGGWAVNTYGVGGTAQFGVGVSGVSTVIPTVWQGSGHVQLILRGDDSGLIMSVRSTVIDQISYEISRERYTISGKCIWTFDDIA